MSVYFEKLFRLNETRVGYIVRSIATTKFAERERNGTIMRHNFYNHAFLTSFLPIILPNERFYFYSLLRIYIK